MARRSFSEYHPKDGVRLVARKLVVGQPFFIAGAAWHDYYPKALRKVAREQGIPIESKVHRRHPDHGLPGIEVIRLPGTLADYEATAA